MAVALRIADVFDRPGGPDHAGSGNVGLWDIASFAWTRVRSVSDADKSFEADVRSSRTSIHRPSRKASGWELATLSTRLSLAEFVSGELADWRRSTF